MVALPTPPPEHGQNARPPATAPNRMSGNIVSGAEGGSNGAEGLQTSPKYDAQTDATGIESSRGNSSQDGSQSGVTTDLLQCYIPDHGRVEKTNSSTMIREFSPEEQTEIFPSFSPNIQALGIVSEGHKHPEYNTAKLGQAFYEESSERSSRLEYSNPSDSILSTKNLYWTISDVPVPHGRLSSGQDGDQLRAITRPNQPDPLSNGQDHNSPLPDWQRPFNHIGEVQHPGPSANTVPHLNEQSTSQIFRNKLGFPMDVASQETQKEPAQGGPNQESPILANADQKGPIPTGNNSPGFISAEQNQIETVPENQSLTGLPEGQMTFTGQEDQQQRRFRREARLHNLLSRNLQTRARAYEKRSQLHQSRSELSIADESFMKLIRERRFNGGQDDLEIEQSFKRLQNARNEYGPLEEAYNAIEEQLNNEEYEAKELEEKILDSESPAFDIDFNSHSGQETEDDSEASEIVRELRHPLYEAYLSRLGDADLCREAIAEKMISHENLLHAQDVRRRIGIHISPDDLAALENFPATEAKLVNELNIIEEDIERLRLECIQEGLFAESENESEREQEIDDEREEISLPPMLAKSINPEQTEYSKYPLLLEKPEEKEDENKSKVLLTDFKQDNIGDRITCWLLHKLRLSVLEVELLARHTNGIDHTANNEKWQEDVLEFWFVDSANLPPSAYQVVPTLTALSFPHSAEFKKESYEVGNLYNIQLVIQSSALSQKLDFVLRLRLSRMKGGPALTV